LTQLSPSDVLKHYAHTLQLSSPKEWEAFVQCFDAYATAVTVAVTAAEQHEILVAQGRAKAFLHLLSLFRECHIQRPPPTPTQPPSA
jgi:hypothetical protein